MLAESDPRIRMVLRLALLPWCYATKIDWEEYGGSRVRAASDLLYIFFRLRYYPDNYGPCRLWELPRAQWGRYYGSSYNPWARARLRKVVQPFDQLEMFLDKERCDEYFRGLGVPLPRSLGVIRPDEDAAAGLRASIDRNAGGDVVAKPVRGARGRGVLLARLERDHVAVVDSRGPVDLQRLRLREPYLVQDRVTQHDCIATIFPNAVNTFRIVTLLTADGEPLIVGSYLRLGRGKAIVDNVSQGGVAVGVDPVRGVLARYAYDARGRRHDRHPDTGVVFDGFAVPCWGEIVEVARRAQVGCPSYRLIGLDVALTRNGPIVIEVNANPDIVGLEQKCGPLLANPRILAEFDRYGLLFNDAQRALAATLLR